MHILSAEKLPLTTSGSPLHIRCKTFLSVTFVLPKERDCQEIYQTLQQLSRPGTINQRDQKNNILITNLSIVQLEDLYCFNYTASSEDVPKHVGWDFFNFQSEYQRIRVPNESWSLTLLNKDYEVRK